MSQKKRFYFAAELLALMVCLGIMMFALIGYSAETDEKPMTGKDGAEMMMIPAGEFQMGSEVGLASEKPVHTIYLDAFYMDKYEVTNAQYKRFVKETGHKEPEGWYLIESPPPIHRGYVCGELHRNFKPWSDAKYNGDDQPVICVTWEDAKAYAEWAGKRLPTAAEWEKAARGGLVGKEYVWGDDRIPPEGAGNLADMSAVNVFTCLDFFPGYNDGFIYTAPVGKFNANGYGLYDMVGNVSEWVSDWYDPLYYATSIEKNPQGPTSGETKAVRGGSWNAFPSYDRVPFRWGIAPTEAYDSLGFRCVSNAK